MSYRLTQEAELDLEAIWDYTIARWDDDQAQRYIAGIKDTIERLSSGALRGRTAEEVRSGYRRASSGSHMIYYRHVGEDIEVVRVLHQRMDPGRHLEQ